MSYRHPALAVMLLSALLSGCTVSTLTVEDGPDPPAQTRFYLDRSALSCAVFETEATSVTLEVSNHVPEAFSAFADISIEDGTGVRTYKVGPGDSTLVHEMPAGEKRVTITSGGQIKSGEEIAGVFVEQITFNRPASVVVGDQSKLVIYGDSIAVGGNVQNPSAEAWPVLLRRHYSVVLEAYGYRALYDDAATPEKIADLASRVSSWEPDDIWLAIGANDYEFAPWTARDFGEAYALTLDAMHAGNPQARIFAQSPLLRADESPNSFGDDPDTFRQQIAAACLARSGWCLYVDGRDPAFPQPGELDRDGIHLTTRSSQKYAEAVLATLDR